VRDIAFCTSAFAHPDTFIYSEYMLAALLWALVYADESYLLVNRAPLIYESGVRWEAERPTGQSACKGGNGQERFLGVSQILEDGVADCEDVASWRIAELRIGRGTHLKGPPPRAGHPEVTEVPVPWPMMPKGPNVVPGFFKREIAPGSWLIHIVVCWPNGYIEDPSRALGMGGEA